MMWVASNAGSSLTCGMHGSRNKLAGNTLFVRCWVARGGHCFSLTEVSLLRVLVAVKKGVPEDS